MMLERSLVLSLPDQLSNLEFERLLKPPFFRNVKQEEAFLRGELVAETLLFGELALPFLSRVEGHRLVGLPLEAPYAELSGEVVSSRREEQKEDSPLTFHLVLRLHFPSGPKWGEQAFRAIAEAILDKTLEKALAQYAQPS
ncbi:MAG: DUF3809 family protein [Thermaceae bacterium]